MPCAKQECYLMVHVWSRAVSMHMWSSSEYCVPVWMSSAESHLGLLDGIVRSAVRFREGELCFLRNRRKVSALCLLY